MYLAVILNLAYVAAIIWASYRHFSRTEAPPMGAQLLSLATAAGTIANVWVTLSLPSASDLLIGLAMALTLAASGLFIAALLATRDRGLSLAYTERTPQAVVNTGIYQTIRHPFYSSYILFWLSWVPLTSIHPLSVAIALAMIASYVFAARKEERLLSNRNGSDYTALMARTWRFFPGLH